MLQIVVLQKLYRLSKKTLFKYVYDARKLTTCHVDNCDLNMTIKQAVCVRLASGIKFISFSSDLKE